MSDQLELFVLPWGLYPRRILLYLAQRNLLSSPIIKITPVAVSQEGQLTAPGKPAGSVPILRLPDGTFIKQSIAILEYLEDACSAPDPTQEWQGTLARQAKKGSMRAQSHEERARTREMLSLADEATSQFGLACHKGSKLFVPMEETNATAARLILEYCKKNLKNLEENFGYEFAGCFEADGSVTIAHCVLYSTLSFAKELYGVDLLEEPKLAKLGSFYEAFKETDDARLEEGFYPEMIKELACQWLQ